MHSPSGALVLSRHADVLAAMRTPDLFHVGTDNDLDTAVRREDRRLRIRAEFASLLTRSRLTDRRGPALAFARELLDRLPVGAPVELLDRFVRPWSLKLALAMTAFGTAQAVRLRQLEELALTGEIDHHGAVKEAKHLFREGGTISAEPLFLGAAETLPHLLSNVVVTFVRHRAAFDQIRARPDLLPNAIEELLRFAGPVHTLHYRAARDVVCNGIATPRHMNVEARAMAGNRDADVFPEPDQLDLARRGAGHLSLGIGPHSCPGAALVRLALGTVLEALAQRNVLLEFTGPIEWRIGSTLFSAVFIPVVVK
ncbi:MAG TPA: cytochrome P450 [Bryobacteraceae bacterium]|nr:cytochrome P450 [Bryobacteraceae bacterium]